MATRENPKLLVTVDTEPDDEWTCRPTLTTRNIRRIPRLQQLFDRHGVRPTYFVSYAVAQDSEAVKILHPIHSQGKCEIGSHLHPWNTPPHFKIRGEVWESHPYLYQYPRAVQRRKFETLHTQLTEAFEVEPRSHRAGRYGLDPYGVQLLKEFGYTVDSSVTPMVCWGPDRQTGGLGPDFRTAPLGVYELSEDDVCAPGRSGVVEVPVSIGYTRPMPQVVVDWLKMQAPERLTVRMLGKLLGIRKRWIYPLPVPLRQIKAAATWLLRRNTGYLQLWFHSSELIRNSDYGKTDEEVANFAKRIEDIIMLARELGCEMGTSLREFAEQNPSE